MLASDLCTRDDVKLALEMQATVTLRDAMIDDAISDASLRIMEHCKRELAPESPAGTARTFPVDMTAAWNPSGHPGTFVDLSPYDLQTATAVVLHPEAGTGAVTLAATDYTLEPVPSFYGTYYGLRISAFIPVWSTFSSEFGYAQIRVTGTWGFDAVPAPAKRACVVTVASWIDRRLGVYGAVEDAGMRMVGPDTTGTLDIPNSAKRLLEPLARRTLAY